VHQREHIAGPEQQLIVILQGLLAESQDAGVIRGNVPPDELATFCLHALEAAGALSSKSAVQRLVTVVLDGLRYRV
jgi:Transcriptional regulator SbtR-like, C-terminal domain